MAAFEGEQIDSASCESDLSEWIGRFFPDAKEAMNDNLRMNLLFIGRHIGQNPDARPVFFSFSDRDNHDLDKVVQRFSFETKLNRLEEDEALQTEYQRSDRYWKTIYYHYDLFTSQYDACFKRMLNLRRQGNEFKPPENIVIASDPLHSREPSEQLKEQVKARDGNQCLCCGEDNKRFLQIDHVAPDYYGGASTLDNLQTLCKICNTDKMLNTINFRSHQTLLRQPPKEALQI
jgi:hypothetical protein